MSWELQNHLIFISPNSWHPGYPSEVSIEMTLRMEILPLNTSASKKTNFSVTPFYIHIYYIYIYQWNSPVETGRCHNPIQKMVGFFNLLHTQGAAVVATGKQTVVVGKQATHAKKVSTLNLGKLFKKLAPPIFGSMQLEVCL